MYVLRPGGGVVIDQMPGRIHRELVDQVPAQPQRAGHRGHTHPVHCQALQDPLRGPPSCLRPWFGRLELMLEDPLGTLIALAQEPRQAHPQACGMPSDRDIGQLPDHVITQPSLSTTPWAEPQRLPRHGLDDRHIALGDARSGDVHPQLESAADDISNRASNGRAGGRFHK